MKESWKVEKLGDVLTVIRGSSPRPIKNFVTEENDGVNWIKIGDVGENEKYVTSTKQKITPEGALRSRYVEEGDFIFSNSMSFGRAYIMKIDGCIHDGWFSFKLPKSINQNYLWYLFRSPNLYEQIRTLAAGAIVQNVSGDLIKKALLPIPPLSEQLAIVEKLDFAFEAIEKAKANIEKNIQNAKELFQSKLNEIFSQKGDDQKDWEIKKLADIFDVRDGTHDSPKYHESGFPLVTSKNLKDGKITSDKIKFISENDYFNINKRSKVDVGDILFAMIGTIGNPVVINDEPNFAIKNVALIKSNDGNDSYFFRYYLDSGKVIEKMKKDSKGATQPFVSLGYMRSFEVPHPNLITQRKVVKRLDDISKQTNLLQEKYKQKLANLEELKKSILEKAFKGELIN